MNARIKGIEYYVPNNVVSNEVFFEHFDKQDKDIRPLMEYAGRRDRHISDDENETVITMALEACKKVLESTGLTGKDIDLIVFASNTPEYLEPTASTIIHHELNCKDTAMVYDVNACCAGMLIGFEQVCRTMMSNKRIKHALVIGTDMLYHYSNPKEEIAYANFGDSSCALILEQTEEPCGLIDTITHTDSKVHPFIVLPKVGLKQALLGESTKEERMISWTPFKNDIMYPSAGRCMQEIIDVNGLTTADINYYCISQFILSGNKVIMETLNETEEKFPYVGFDLGYTANTSPFIPLCKLVEENKIKRGDKIIFWTVGAGGITMTLLFEY